MKTTVTRDLFDQGALRAAEQTTSRAIRQLLAPGSRPKAVVVSAPAGAGKSQLVIEAVRQARAKNLRVAVASPTNDQAQGLVRRAWELHTSRQPRERVSFCGASGRNLPDELRRRDGVEEVTAKEANGRSLVVGTLAKLGDAFARGALGRFDVLLIDESYQADSAAYFAIADLAPVHLLVGDSGQISPFSTLEVGCPGCADFLRYTSCRIRVPPRRAFLTEMK
jgi:hypothetical protein